MENQYHKSKVEDFLSWNQVGFYNSRGVSGCFDMFLKIYKNCMKVKCLYIKLTEIYLTLCRRNIKYL